MPQFKVSKKAEEDLLRIGKYTQENWGVSQRNKYLDEIEQQFYLLAENPNHPTVQNRSNIKNGIFSLLVNKHIIIFRKHSYGVRIVRVLSQSMLLGKHI